MMRWDLSRAGRLGAGLILAGLLAACAGSPLDSLGLSSDNEPVQPQNAAGDVIGNGSVKVALILPISSQNGQAAAQSLRNAAELAVEDFSGGNAASS
ncbi:MAG: penicillin-binding protein activator, partial [Methylobacterium sp.]|nr:penicillin-binding protein activator [Methylobacterium sp.]